MKFAVLVVFILIVAYLYAMVYFRMSYRLLL